MVCWDADGHRFRIYSDGVEVLETPFVLLPTSPAVLMGQDPASGLPAYCPPPDNAGTGSVAIPPLTGGDCTQMRCGAALAMTERLNGLYRTWQQWINAGLGVIANISVGLLLNWLGALIEALVAAERVASWLLPVFNRIRTPLSILTLAEIGTVLPAWDPTTVDNVQRVFFGALQCTSGSVGLTAGDMVNVAGFIRTHTSSFLGDIVAELLASIVEFSTLGDWQAVVSGAAPSTLCAGY